MASFLSESRVFGVCFVMACHKSTGSPRESAVEVVIASEAESLDPRYVTDPIGLRVTRLVHAGLFRIDPSDLRPVPLLASSYAWTSATTLSISLRKGCRFHSGAELTPRDVMETLRAFRAPEVASRHTRVFEPIEEITQTEDGVAIRLKRPHATLLTDLEVPILRWDEAASPRVRKEPLDGLGPFRIQAHAPGELRLEPTPGCSAATPSHSVVLRTIRDENARLLRLLSGRADLAFQPVAPPLFGALPHRPRLAPNASLTYLLFQHERIPDPRARRRIASMVPRDRLATVFFGDAASVATTLIPHGHWAHEPLHEAPTNGTTPVDTPLTLLTSTDRLRLAIARFLAAELSDRGLVVQVIPLELGLLLSRLSAGDFDLAMLQIPEIIEPNVLRNFLHSEAVPPHGPNRGRVKDPKLDNLLDRASQDIDPNERKRLYGAVEALNAEEAHILPLVHEHLVVYQGDRVTSFEPSRDGRWGGLATVRMRSYARAGASHDAW